MFFLAPLSRRCFMDCFVEGGALFLGVILFMRVRICFFFIINSSVFCFFQEKWKYFFRIVFFVDCGGVCMVVIFYCGIIN